jgi:hypothetical protein
MKKGDGIETKDGSGQRLLYFAIIFGYLNG